MSAPSSLAAVHARLLRDRALQFDFKAVKPPKPPHLPDWFLALGRWLGHLIEAALPVLKVVFWVGIALAVAAVIFVIVREVMGSRFGWAKQARPARAAPVDWRPDGRKARALLENADRLAAQGRFDLAVRLILHRGIEDIDAKRPRLVKPALTAREIVSLPELPAGPRAAFTRMAAIVEFSAFAGQAIGQTAFTECRSAYEAFAFSDAWQ